MRTVLFKIGLFELLCIGTRIASTIEIGTFLFQLYATDQQENGVSPETFFYQVFDNAILLLAILCLIGATKDEHETPNHHKLFLLEAWIGLTGIYNIVSCILGLITWGSCQNHFKSFLKSQMPFAVLNLVLIYFVIFHTKFWTRIEEAVEKEREGRGRSYHQVLTAVKVEQQPQRK